LLSFVFKASRGDMFFSVANDVDRSRDCPAMFSARPAQDEIAEPTATRYPLELGLEVNFVGRGLVKPQPSQLWELPPKSRVGLPEPGETNMTFPNNSPRRNDGYSRSNGMGAGTWVAIAVVIALIVVGAIYWNNNSGSTSTADNDHATPVTTTGSAPTSPAPTSAPAPAPAKK
jgi:hypothetical protein